MRTIISLSILLLFVGLTSCNSDIKNTQKVFIGGQIENPSSEYVIISKNDVDIDTFQLNENNRFSGELNNIEAGLYVFKHPPENQIMYLEPGDSTLVFVNTLDFDESINFSGKGAKESNFLNKIYLQNQKNNDLILHYYKVKPEEFAYKTDSIREARTLDLTALRDRYDLSEEFYDLAAASINYEFYDLRERYTFLIEKYYHEYANNIPSDFHEYRKDISFNDKASQDNYIYLNFLDDYFRSKSIEDCKSKKSSSEECYDLNSYENIKSRMKMVDSNIEIESIRNSFLELLAAQGIIYSQNKENINSIVETLKSMNYSGRQLKDIEQMAMIQNNLLPGSNIGHLKLLNSKNEPVMLKDISRKPIITYHWTLSSQGHHKWENNIIEDLRFKYPEINFIGINIDKDQFDIWQNRVAQEVYDQNFEYKLEIITVKQKLLKNYLNKLLFVKADGTIVRGDVQLNSPELENKILEFISQK
ncbi:hypothetical protein [Gillisia sp. Hel_I_29]|uniref:hypothetical protein n=1 Tax=Gillisia sp. Hel_I_29 TaxID=1249975 RepID=UPI0005577D9F|nr:hypothetical protein [Gillisia sp. Hel_I_29]